METKMVYFNIYLLYMHTFCFGTYQTKAGAEIHKEESIYNDYQLILIYVVIFVDICNTMLPGSYLFWKSSSKQYKNIFKQPKSDS